MSNYDLASYPNEQDLTGFWLQAGFVEGIIADRKSFNTLPAAYRHIFRRNLEYAIILWNGIPIRLSYIEDIPEMVPPLIDALQMLTSKTVENSTFSVTFHTPNLETQWQIKATSELVIIDSLWRFISGDYKAALNQLSVIQMSRTAFLCEWQLLLQQLNKAIVDAEATLIDASPRAQLEKLNQIESQIPSGGRFYQYADRG